MKKMRLLFFFLLFLFNLDAVLITFKSDTTVEITKIMKSDIINGESDSLGIHLKLTHNREFIGSHVKGVYAAECILNDTTYTVVNAEQAYANAQQVLAEFEFVGASK